MLFHFRALSLVAVATGVIFATAMGASQAAGLFVISDRNYR